MNNKIDVSLISTIYDATLDEKGWQDVVDTMSAHIPGTTSSICNRTFGPEIEEIVLQSGFDPYHIDAYLAHFKKLNPVLKALENQKTNSLKYEDFLYRMSEIAHTEYYNGFLKPQNFKSGIHVKLNCGSKNVIWFSKLIEGDEDSKLTAQSLWQVRAYLPHISRAIQISRHISNSRINILNLEDTIDKMSVSAFVIDSSQSVFYANLSAKRLLATSAELQINSFNQIQASHPSSDERLQAAISFALSHSHSPAPVKIQRSDGTRPLIAIILRYHHDSEWQSKFSKLFSDETQSICLFIFDPSTHMAPLNGLIASAFNLTPAQTKLTRALAQGYRLQDYADIAGISRNTARNHLAAIMEKMGITRQSELISIISQLSAIDCSPK
jgi:DNA-binding CsgD family transcriptional regulator